MKKLLAIMFALVLSSSFAFAQDNTTDDAYFHAHLYCPYGLEAGPDVFLGDFFVGEENVATAMDPIEFRFYGQAAGEPTSALLAGYYDGFENWPGWDMWGAGHGAAATTDDYPNGEHYDVLVGNQSIDGEDPVDGEVDGQDVFFYEAALYTLSFVGEVVQPSLSNGSGDVWISTQASLDGGNWVDLNDMDQDPNNVEWTNPEYRFDGDVEVACSGEGTFEVRATELSSDDTVAPGPYTFKQTLTIDANNM